MKVKKLSPNFEVADIKKTVCFYQENFGFKLVMAVPESRAGVEQKINSKQDYIYAMMQKDNLEFMFERSDSFKSDLVFAKNLKMGASVSFYIEIEGLKEFYEDLKNKNLEITDLKTTWYGMNEFYVKDLNGYIIGFAEKAK